MCTRVNQRPNPMPSYFNPAPASNVPAQQQPQQGGSIDIEWGRVSINWGNNNNNSPTSYCPPPNQNLSCAPQGQGLTKNADGSVTTAGGYKIQPEGKDSAFKIFGPDGKELTRVWGDPHVQEGDGTKWDFTKDSNFVLPDGTRIGLDTTSQTGKSVTQALDIANGNDRVQISGINSKTPTTGEITRDGLSGWQAANGAGRDTFSLRHDASGQDWVKYDPTGKLGGVVTGAKYENNEYQQITSGADSTRAGAAPGQLAGGVPGQVPGAAQGGFGLQQLLQLLGLGGMSGLSGMGGNSALGGNGMAFADPFGLGFGGLGSAGVSPYGGLQAFGLLQALMQSSLREQQMQIEYGRMRATFR